MYCFLPSADKSTPSATAISALRSAPSRALPGKPRQRVASGTEVGKKLRHRGRFGDTLRRAERIGIESEIVNGDLRVAPPPAVRISADFIERIFLKEIIGNQLGNSVLPVQKIICPPQ